MNSFLPLGIAAITGFAMGRLTNKIRVPAFAGYVLRGNNVCIY